MEAGGEVNVAYRPLAVIFSLMTLPSFIIILPVDWDGLPALLSNKSQSSTMSKAGRKTLLQEAGANT